MKKLVDTLLLDDNGQRVVTQKPNAPIVVWIITFILSFFLPEGSIWQQVASVIATFSLIFWAVLELVRGVNLFRRMLGATVLLVVIASQFV